MHALTKAFRNFTARNAFCAIGSVKTNVGHLDAAAGMAAIIKTVLALRHRRIPPTLNFSTPNPEIDFAATPFFVNTAPLDWRGTDGPRRAGVMGTGMGGTNAFVVLEQAPEPAPGVTDAGPQLLLFSAKAPKALAAATRAVGEFLSSSRPPNEAADLLADAAHTLRTGRTFFSHRRFAVCQNLDGARATLLEPDSANLVSGEVRSEGVPPAIFLIPGIGDHYVGMGRGLYQRCAVFRDEVDRCAAILHPLLGTDIREILFPPASRSAASMKPRGIDLKQMLGRVLAAERDPAAEKLEETIYNQPSLFTIEYALARLWQSWGITPERIVGHSMGEYVAASLADVFSLPDALRLIVARAKLVQALPRAAMLAVMLPERDVLPLLPPELSISLINGPSLCVIAGPPAAIERLRENLASRGTVFRPVRNAHAFHSRTLDPIVGAFTDEVRRVKLSAPRIPFISNVTGTCITPAQAVDPLYWAEHARTTARFSDALAQLWKLPEHTLIEVGPGRTLGVLAMQHPARAAAMKPLIVSSLRHVYENQPDVDYLFNSVGRLWLSGIEIKWDQFDSRAARRKISLPAYPFERVRCWIDPVAGKKSSGGSERPDRGDWFYVPSWTRAHPPAADQAEDPAAKPLWLIVGDETEFSARLMRALVARNADVTVAKFGGAFVSHDERTWEIQPAAPDDYVELIGALKPRLAHGLNVVHVGALSPRVNSVAADAATLNAELGFHSLLCLAQALGEHTLSVPVRIGAVTRQIFEVTGEETLNPAMATVVGLCGVLPREYSNVNSFVVDLPAALSAGSAADDWVQRLLAEFRDSQSIGCVLAYRGKFRWERNFRPQKIPAAAARSGETAVDAAGFRTRGVYLITGGTGGLGLAIAKHLAETCRARLVLVKKNSFPERAAWNQRLAAGTLTGEEKRIVEAVLDIEACGGEVEIHACESTDRVGLQRIVAATLAKYGALHGVIHAAGILREGMIQLKTRAVADAVLAPKVAGVCALFEAVKDLELDAFVLFSSISSVVSFHGQSAYCAANAFLDAFAPYANAHARFPTIAIDWPVWREVGILTSLKIPASLDQRREAVRQQAILTRDGVEIFRRAYLSKIPQLIVSPRDLDFVIADAGKATMAMASVDRTPSSSPAAARRPAGDPPRDEVEKAVAELWSGLLGTAAIGVHENFLDLGGHSLLAMRIVAQIRTAYQVDFTLRKFFEHPTIAGNAAAIQAEIVAEVESLTEDEVSQRVS